MDLREELERMVMGFRVLELQSLLGFVNKNKIGKKSELQGRALSVIRNGPSIRVTNKIRELSRRRMGSAPEGPSAGAGGGGGDGLVDLRSVALQAMRPPTAVAAASRPAPISNTSGTLVSRENFDYYPSMPRLVSTSILNSNQANQKTGQSFNSLLPILVDVTFKRIPFYEVLGDLLKPATLMPTQGGNRFNESTYSFHLTPGQANQVAMSRSVHFNNKVEHDVQIQLRFCLMETTSPQEDNFPPSICVKVNTKMCPLPNPLPNNKPGIEPKRPSKPVDITGLSKISPVVPNHISVSWASEFGRPYVVGVFLARQLAATDLLQKIKNKGVRNSEYTKAMVMEKLGSEMDAEIATTSLRGSLLCPLGKMRMSIPCRSVTCCHIQCFDALLYLQMNERKPSWICPVCDKPAAFEHLAIDGLFAEILKDPQVMRSANNEIEFNEDGSWSAVVVKKEPFDEGRVGGGVKREPLSSDLEDGQDKKFKKKTDVDIITIDEDDSNDFADNDLGETLNLTIGGFKPAPLSAPSGPSMPLLSHLQQSQTLLPSSSDRRTASASLSQSQFDYDFNDPSSFAFGSSLDQCINQFFDSIERSTHRRGQQHGASEFDQDVISID